MFGDFFRFAWRPDADGPFVLLRWHDCGIVMSRIGTYLNPRAVLGEGCSGVPRLERVRGASYLGVSSPLAAYSSASYAVRSHRFTSSSMSFPVVISMRCVMRSFFSYPPVLINRLGVLRLPSARPRSIRVLVVGLICAKTCLR